MLDLQPPALDADPYPPELFAGELVEPLDHDLDVDPLTGELVADDEDEPDEPLPRLIGGAAADFFLAPALGDQGLRGEVNALFPRRDKASDGWIGDPSHAARKSDHNPAWNDPGKYRGIVRATDTDVDDGDPKRNLRRLILNAALGDPRVWYIITNRTIYSSTFGFAARRYTGSNPHVKHIHLSLRHQHREFDTSRWIDSKPVTPKKKRIKATVDLSNVRAEFLRALDLEPGEVDARPGVAHIQRALNALYSTGLDVDGYVGKGTLNAWGLHETHHAIRGTGRPRVPDLTSLAALSMGRYFRVLP